jgi:anti-anti-sigma factor
MDNIRIQERGKFLCASLAGRLAQAESEELARRLFKHLAGKEGVLLDLSEVEYMSSSAVGAVVCLCQQVRMNGGRMAVVAPDDRVHLLLEVAGLNQILDLCRSTEEAESCLKAKPSEGSA